MRGGPVGSGYPGTPAALVMAGFCAFLLGRCVLSAYRRWRSVTLRQNLGATIWVGLRSCIPPRDACLGNLDSPLTRRAMPTTS